MAAVVTERTSRWHLEEAAIHQQLADQAAKRGYWGSHDKHALKAAWHREQAQLAARQERVA